MNFDILRLISLYLPFNFLNINKKLSNIYDESWFKDKLLFQYDNIINNNYTWEWLYRRSLKSGEIFLYNEDHCNIQKICNINGIKICEITSNFVLSIKEDLEKFKFNMVLTFTGDLYSFYRDKEYVSDLILIDTDVIDIDDNAYIKNNQLYVFPERTNKTITAKILAVTSDSNFIAVASKDNYITALTTTNFYCYNTDTIKQKLKIYSSINNIGLVFSGNFIIQNVDHSLTIYEHLYDKFKKFEMKEKAKKIYPGCVKLLNDDLMIIAKYHVNNFNEISYYNVKNNKNNFVNSIFNCGIPFLLIDNNVYSSKNIIRNHDEDLLLIYENVKNIYGRFEIYFIR